jgi:hypothetical protein
VSPAGTLSSSHRGNGRGIGVIVSRAIGMGHGDIESHRADAPADTSLQCAAYYEVQTSSMLWSCVKAGGLIRSIRSEQKQESR